MSLLHKALKKAEREGPPAERSPFFIDAEDPHRSSSPRVFLLAGVAVACLLLVVYVRLVRRPEASSYTPKDFSTPLQIGGGPAAPALAAKADEMMEKGRFEEARENLEKVVILEPRNAEAYNNLGLALKKLGRNEEAFEQYRKALSIDPGCAECLNNLGVLYLVNRDLSEAESHFQKAIEARPDYADPHFHLGLLLEARGDLEGAKRSYLKFVELARGIDADFLLKIQQRVASLRTGGS